MADDRCEKTDGETPHSLFPIRHQPFPRQFLSGQTLKDSPGRVGWRHDQGRLYDRIDINFNARSRSGCQGLASASG